MPGVDSSISSGPKRMSLRAVHRFRTRAAPFVNSIRMELTRHVQRSARGPWNRLGLICQRPVHALYTVRGGLVKTLQCVVRIELEDLTGPTAQHGQRTGPRRAFALRMLPNGSGSGCRLHEDRTTRPAPGTSSRSSCSPPKHQFFALTLEPEREIGLDLRTGSGNGVSAWIFESGRVLT